MLGKKAACHQMPVFSHGMVCDVRMGCHGRREGLQIRECSRPSFLRKRASAKVFMKNNQDLFVQRFKSLAPGRAAGGIFNVAAYAGKGW